MVKTVLLRTVILMTTEEVQLKPEAEVKSEKGAKPEIKIAIISDFFGTLTPSRGEEIIRQCCVVCGKKPSEMVPIIENPELEEGLDSDALARCDKIIDQATEKTEIVPSALDALIYWLNNGCDVYISSSGNCDSIANRLRRENDETKRFIVLGRKSGSKKNHLRIIREKKKYDIIIMIGDSAKDFKNDVDFKIAVNVRGDEEFLMTSNIYAHTPDPLDREILATILRSYIKQ
ncbi:MAG: HAD family hydrolase [Candidatus Paceibacterota bacterium]